MSNVIKEKYYGSVAPGFNHRTAMEEAGRCLLCHDAPCSKGCPAGTDPARFIRSLRFRNDKGAAETIRENNIMGASCARICPYERLCEEACSRCGIDRPIEIGKLQRYLMEQEKVYGMKTLQPPEEKKAERIACVGAGPASIACGAELAKAGYQVTIFEREEKPGGVLSYAILPSRVPEEVVEQDIQCAKDLGIEFVMGKEVSAAELEDYDAVFIGAGMWKVKLPGIPGDDLEGVYPAGTFLKKARLEGEKFGPLGKVVVIGGGDVAIDSAVTAKQLGAEDVRIVYRRTLEEAPGNMTGFQHALALGIGITTNMAPDRVEGNGKVERMVFTGRKDVTENSLLILEVDIVVFAVGQAAEDLSEIAPVKATEKGLIETDGAGRTDQGKFFAGGDIVNGGKSVVEAVADGKAAAASIREYLETKQSMNSENNLEDSLANNMEKKGGDPNER